MLRASSSSSKTQSRARCCLPLTRAAAVAFNTEVTNAPSLSPGGRKTKIQENNVWRNAAFRDLEKMKSANSGRLSHADIEFIVQKYQSRKQNVKRCHLDYRRCLWKQGLALPGEEKKKATPAPPVDNVTTSHTVDGTNLSPLTTSVASTVASTVASPVTEVREEAVENVSEKNKGGRKKGSTYKAKTEHLQKVKQALEEATTLCLEEKDLAESTKQRVSNGKYIEIFSLVCSKYGLVQEEEGFKYETLRARLRTRNVNGMKNVITSPLEGIEPEVVDWCCKASRMGEAMTKYELMELADDLIRGTVYEQKYNDYRKKLGIKRNEKDGNSIVGERWFEGFLKRWSIELISGKCLVQDTVRHTWCVKEHFENMYNAVYNNMVECGVAIKLDHDIMYDDKGNIVTDASLMCGRPTRYKITRPDRCVFVDETGCNTNQKFDGHVAGRRYIKCRRQLEGARTGSTSDLHFTVLAFTAGTGDIIMCAVIMKSESNNKNVPPSWRWGIDMTKNVETGRTEAETWNLNCKNDVCKGGPVCFFNGAELPTFVCSSPSASITSKLLVQMFQEMDKRNLFERSPELGTPFVLIDGHQSRTSLPFLRYVNDPLTAWRACIGVPYGTHIWQPHDSSELNGTFKVALYKAKQNYLREKPATRKNFVSSDIIPILNRCWDGTLNNQRFALKSIRERGWNPLNYVLLDDPRLVRDEIIANGVSNENFLNTFRHKNGQVYTSRLNSLVVEQSKCAGRKRKNEQVLADLRKTTAISMRLSNQLVGVRDLEIWLQKVSSIYVKKFVMFCKKMKIKRMKKNKQ